VSLEPLELWDAVEGESEDRAKDRRVLAAILHGVPPEMKAGLAVKKMVKEAWVSVKKMRGGDECVKAANVQRLMKEFELLSFGDGETVAEFAVRVDRLTARLGDLGEGLNDSRVVRKVLRVVPRRLKQVAVSVEIHGDLHAMMLTSSSGSCKSRRMRMPRMSRRPRVGAASSCFSPRLSGRHIRAEEAGVVVATMEVTATTMTMGRATCVPGQAGVVEALAKGGASTMASAATSPGSVPSQGRRRHCTATLTKN
jgi:hypothetical protein